VDEVALEHIFRKFLGVLPSNFDSTIGPYISLPTEMRDSPDQATCYHVLDVFYLGTSSLVLYLADCRGKQLSSS
jgi:hypothetical protein